MHLRSLVQSLAYDKWSSNGNLFLLPKSKNKTDFKVLSWCFCCMEHGPEALWVRMWGRCWGIARDGRAAQTGIRSLACCLLLLLLPWILPQNPATHLFKLFLPSVGILSKFNNKLTLCMNWLFEVYSGNGPLSWLPKNIKNWCRLGGQHHAWRERRP